MKTNLLYLIAVAVSSLLPAKANVPDLPAAQGFIRNQKPSFEQNKGQLTGTDADRVKYFLKSGNMTFYLLENGISYQFTKSNLVKESGVKSPEEIIKNHSDSENFSAETYRIDMILQGANAHPFITTENPETGSIHYNNKNILNVQRFSKITYHDIYPNIDWVIYIKGDNVEYDFIIHPGGNPDQIQFRNKWAEGMKLNEDGSLTMSCRLGSITEKAPVSFQNGKNIPTKMVLKDDMLSFKVQSYDRKSTLTLDPEIYWSTYFGGGSNDFGTSCVTDASGNVYLAGYTYSGSGIASGGYQNFNNGDADAFLAKFSSGGTLLWATFYGGSNEDKGKSVALDSSGNIYLAGETYSNSNIATASAHQTGLGGVNDAFLVKFDNNGNLLWGTYYGGDFYDEGYSCAVDISGNVYLSGFSWSGTGIATSVAHQQTIGGSTDAFLVKFNSDGVRQWGTYYGGELWESGYCTTDVSGNVYLAGFTSSSVNIASEGAHQTTLGWGDDAYLVKFNSDGVRQWGTYYGGSDYDWAYFIATDSQGNVYLDGHTGSDGVIATSDAYQTTRAGSYDAFLVKFNGNGNRIWGTYYGGTEQERASACSVDASDNIILTGYTYSDSNIASAGSYQTTYGGGQDAFAAKFDSAGNRIWGTYLGGSGDDFGAFCTADSSGNVYITGNTNSDSGISSAGSHQPNPGGSIDAFLTKLTPNGTFLNVKDAPSASLKIFPNPAADFLSIKSAEKIKSTEIFDATGRSVAKFGNTQNLDVSTLEKGVYVIKISTEKGVNQQKFIKK